MKYINNGDIDLTRKKDSDGSTLEMDFTLHKMKQALKGCGQTAPDQLCYV